METQQQDRLEHLARSVEAWVTGATTARHDLARKLALACRRLDRLVQHAAADTSHAQWAEAMRRLSAQIDARDRRIADLEASMISLQRELGRLREAVKSAKEGRASYMADVEALRKQHALLQSELASKTQQVAVAEGRLAKSEQFHQTLEDREGQITRLQQQLEEAQALARATAREKDAEIAEVQASLFEAEQALGEVSARLDEETAELRAALAEKGQALVALEQAFDKAAAQREQQPDHTQEIRSLRQQLNEAQALLAVKNAELTELSAALEESQMPPAPDEGLVAALRQQLETAQGAERALHEAEARAAALEQRLAEVESAAAASHEGGAMPREDTQTLAGDIQGLKTLLDARAEEVHQLAVERDEAQARIMELETRLGDAEALAPQLEQALRDRDEAHTVIVALRDRLESDSGAAVQGEAPTHDIPAFDQAGHKRRIGEILLAMGVIDQEQLQRIVSEQGRDRQQRFGTLAVEMGFTSEELVARVLAAQLRLPYAQVANAQVDASVLGLLSPEAARKNRCLPILRDNQRLRLAMANPLDLIAIENVEIASGLRVEPVVAAPGDLEAAIARLYSA